VGLDSAVPRGGRRRLLCPRADGKVARRRDDDGGRGEGSTADLATPSAVVSGAAHDVM